MIASHGSGEEGPRSHPNASSSHNKKDCRRYLPTWSRAQRYSGQYLEFADRVEEGLGVAIVQ